jgi:hypothetical protein
MERRFEINKEDVYLVHEAKKIIVKVRFIAEANSAQADTYNFYIADILKAESRKTLAGAQGRSYAILWGLQNEVSNMEFLSMYKDKGFFLKDKKLSIYTLDKDVSKANE